MNIPKPAPVVVTAQDFALSQTASGTVNPSLLEEQMQASVTGWSTSHNSITIRPPQIEVLASAAQSQQVSAVISAHDGTQQASAQKAAAQELSNIQALVASGSTKEIQQLAAFLVRRFNA